MSEGKESRDGRIEYSFIAYRICCSHHWNGCDEKNTARKQVVSLVGCIHMCAIYIVCIKSSKLGISDSKAAEALSHL